MLFAFSDGLSIESLLQRQKVKLLPADKSIYQRVIVRRKKLWEDALARFQAGIDFSKYIRVIFVGEPAVDDGGPLREFLRLLMGAIATNNLYFEGEKSLRIPACNMKGLENNVYHHIGEMISVSLIHGGPAPIFLAPCVVDYMIYGIKLKSNVSEVPNSKIREKLEEVGNNNDDFFFFFGPLNIYPSQIPPPPPV